MSQGLIQGSMREAPLPDIIQLVSQNRKSGCFYVVEEPKRARIYMKDGRLVHAVSNDAEGLDVVYEVALWLDGRYHFEECEVDVPTTITKGNPSVLMEMHRRMDEWRVINQKIGSMDLYPASTLLPGDVPQGVSPRETKLLSLLTGFYTVAELAEVMHKPVINVAKDLYGLVMAGHVVLKGVRSGKRPAEVPTPAQTPVPTPADVAAPPPPPPPVDVPPPAVPMPEPMSIPEPELDVRTPPAPTPVPPPAPVPHAHAAHAPHVSVPQHAKAVPSPAPVLDPMRMAKLNAFCQRIVQTAMGILPVELHEQIHELHTRATHQIMQGEGPEAVKNLALTISKSATEAHCNPELVKRLNAQLKALFSK